MLEGPPEAFQAGSGEEDSSYSASVGKDFARFPSCSMDSLQPGEIMRSETGPRSCSRIAAFASSPLSTVLVSDGDFPPRIGCMDWFGFLDPGHGDCVVSFPDEVSGGP